MKRRKIDLTSSDAAIREVDRLHIGGYKKAGTWDLAQACDHMHRVMSASMDGYQMKPPWFMRLIRPLARRRTFGTRSMPAGFKAPGVIQPQAGLSESEAVTRFKATLGRAFDPAAVFKFHPIMGNLSPEQNRQLHLIHISHHFSFLIPQDRIVT